MITQEDADHLTCEEAAKLPRSIELEDEETLLTIVGKAMMYMAVKGEFELLVDEKGQFSFKKN
ncbi:hypothetical protein ES703_06884 [subsurface metagenome]